MKEGTTARNYAYGARVAKDVEQTAVDILAAAHRFRNMLVEIELLRRKEWHDALRKHLPRIAEIDETIEPLAEKCKELRERGRELRVLGRSKTSDAEVASDLKAASKELKKLRAERKSLEEQNAGALKSISGASKVANKKRLKEARDDARKELDVGTVQHILECAKAFRSGPPPKFKRFDGTGTIAICSVTGGFRADGTADVGYTVGEPTGAHAQLEIAGREPSQGKNPWRHCRLRIGLIKREPVYLPFRCKLHRPIPDDATVKWAKLIRKRVGVHFKWQLVLTLQINKDTVPGPTGTGTVAILPGWRSLGGDIEAAYWVGDDSKQGAIVIPKEQLDRQHKVEDLQAIRDKHFDQIKPILKTFLNDVECTYWFADACTHIDKWRSPRRLAVVMAKWRDNRFAGDREIWDRCEVWRKKDKHLFTWQAHQRQGVQDWRKSRYRQHAAQLARMYDKVVVPDVNYAALARKKDIGQDDGRRCAPAIYRKLASPGLLVQLLKEKLPITKVAVDMSVCGVCGNTLAFGSRCAACGHAWSAAGCYGLLRAAVAAEGDASDHEEKSG
jgi:hypothetical protein